MKRLKMCSLTRLSNALGFAFVAMLCVVVSSCGDDEIVPSLEINNTSIFAPQEGTTETILISSNSKWSITGYPSWVTIFPSTGEGDASVSLSISENNSIDSRSCVVNINSVSGDLNKQISIEQEGAEVKLSVDIYDVALGAQAESSQDIMITCNTSWTLSGLPDWLVSSASSGNETSVITLTALSVNNSATERTANLVLSAGGKEVNIVVKQRAALANVSVIPKDIVALWDGLCFEFAATGDIYYFYWECIAESELNRLNDAAIIDRLKSGEKRTYVDNWILFPGNLTDNTTYYIVTLSYEQNDKQGELVKTKVTTPEYIWSSNEDAWVMPQCASDGGYDYDEDSYTYYIEFRFTKQAYCHKYHAVMAAGISENHLVYPGVAFAFQINYYKVYGKKHWFGENLKLDIYLDYPNTDVFPVIYSGKTPYALMFGWGIFENGVLSSDITGGYIDLSAEESRDTRSGELLMVPSSEGKAIRYDGLKLSDLRKIVKQK